MGVRLTGALRPCPSDLVGVLTTAEENRLVALRAIKPGELLFRVDGRKTNLPSKYSVQIDAGWHLDPGVGPGAHEAMDAHFWRFMNHSCDPNVILRDLRVVGLRAIHPGEDLTFDYHTTEYELAEPFGCRCGSARCLGVIRGFRYLSPAARERLRHHLPSYLMRYLDPAPNPATVAAPR